MSRKVFGFPFDLVKAAVMSRVFSGEDALGGLPAFGSFEHRGGRWWYLMDVAEGQPPLELQIDLDSAAEEAIRSGIPHREFVLLEKNCRRYRLLVAFGSQEEEAKEALDESVVEEYLEFHRIDTREGIKQLVDWFAEYVSGIHSGSRCARPPVP